MEFYHSIDRRSIPHKMLKQAAKMSTIATFSIKFQSRLTHHKSRITIPTSARLQRVPETQGISPENFIPTVFETVNKQICIFELKLFHYGFPDPKIKFNRLLGTNSRRKHFKQN